jgi:hypothetical protein
MGYRITSSTGGKSGKQRVYRLTVPPSIASDLDPELEFEPELTEDGILYRPVVEREAPKPKWAKRKKT